MESSTVRPGNMYKVLDDYSKDNYYIKDQSWKHLNGNLAPELVRAMKKGQEKHSVREHEINQDRNRERSMEMGMGF